MIAYIVTVILSGGFYAYSAMIAGILAVIAFLRTGGNRAALKEAFITNGSHRITALNLKALIPLLLCLYPFISMLWAFDRPVHLEGAIRLSALIPFILLFLLYDEKDKYRILSAVPYLGSIMVMTGIISIPFDAVSSMFWQSERFLGFFGYANTCALFLFLSLAIRIGKMEQQNIKGIGTKDIVMLLCLLSGILMTGCRSILLLMIPWAIYKCIRNKRLLKYMLPAGAAIAAVAAIYAFVSDNEQNIGRIFTLSTHQSTIFGRILYIKDGIRLLPLFPFGLGFGGYYEVQPVYQNGLYNTRFVHNDYLQSCLDLGILPGLLIMTYLIFQIIKGRQDERRKEYLVIILVSALSDFHFQYLSILITALLCLDLGTEERNIIIDPGDRDITCMIVSGGLILFYSFFLIPFAAFYLHLDEQGLKLYPHETEAELRLLRTAETSGRAESLALSILSHDSLCAEAYRHLGYIGAMKEDYGAAVYYMDKMIDSDRYDIESYRSYDKLLKGDLIPKALDSGDMESVRVMEEAGQRLEERLENLRNTTDPISFRLRDKPVFTLYD